MRERLISGFRRADGQEDMDVRAGLVAEKRVGDLRLATACPQVGVGLGHTVSGRVV